MLSYSIYKFVHILGIVCLAMSVGGAICATAEIGQKPQKVRKLVAITHGLGMLLVLLGGFGMLARLGIHWPWPWWIVLKLLAWLSLGLYLCFTYKWAVNNKNLIWIATFLIFTISAGAVLVK